MALKGVYVSQEEDRDWKSFLLWLQSSNEEEALRCLRRFVVLHTKERFKAIYPLYQLRHACAQGKYQCTPLFEAVSEGHLHLVETLLSMGAPVDKGAMCEDPLSFLHNQSPLFMACDKKAYKMVECILRFNPNLLHQNGEGDNVLMKVTTLETLDLIITRARKSGCLYSLISAKDKQGLTAFEHACLNGKPELLQRLIKINDYHRYVNVNSVLTYARNASFEIPALFKEFDALCIQLKPLSNKKQKPDLIYDENKGEMEEARAYSFLFNKANLKPPALNEQEAVERVISQWHALLGTPDRCIPYLEMIEKEFCRYCRETYGVEFPPLNRDSIVFRKVDRYYFPLPTDDYVGMKKHHALQEFFVLFFQKHGLPAKVFEWIGFIPHSTADRIISEGNFGVETHFGGGLFHGKMAHMLQVAIFICAIYRKDEKIDLTYEEKGEQRQLSIRTLLNALVTLNKAKSSYKLWHYVMDSGIIGKITFHEPHMLSSFIMHQGINSGMPVLSDYLVDSFCKGLRKNVSVYNDVLQSDMNMHAFLDKMDEANLVVFSTPDFLIQYSLKRTQEKAFKRNSDVIEASGSYGVVEKTYSPNRHFQLL